MKKNNVLIIVLVIALLAVLTSCFYYLKINSQKRELSSDALIVGNNYPFTVEDAMEYTVTIEKEPQRIISLSPGATEILFAVGSGDRVIAVSEFCTYPPEVKELPKVGGYTNPSIEKITALKPDLVVAMRGNDRETIQKLRELKINVITFDPISIYSLNEALSIIGKVTNGKNADDLIKDINYSIDSVKTKGEALEFHPKVLFLFSPDGALYSAGPNSHIDEMITIAGGKNIAHDATSAWPQLSMEVVSAKNPDVILITSQNMGAGEELSLEKVRADFKADKKWKHIAAVKNNNVFFVSNDEICTLSPRSINELDKMYDIFKNIQK